MTVGSQLVRCGEKNLLASIKKSYFSESEGLLRGGNKLKLG